MYEFKNRRKPKRVEAVIDLETPCRICEQVIERLKTERIKQGEVIMFRPEFNASGHLMHFHVEVIKDAGFKVADGYEVAK